MIVGWIYFIIFTVTFSQAPDRLVPSVAEVFVSSLKDITYEAPVLQLHADATFVGYWLQSNVDAMRTFTEHLAVGLKPFGLFFCSTYLHS